MGGARQVMPVTFVLILSGCLAAGDACNVRTY